MGERHIRVRASPRRRAIISRRIDRARFATHWREAGFHCEVISEIRNVLGRSSATNVVVRERAKVGCIGEIAIIVKSDAGLVVAAEGIRRIQQRGTGGCGRTVNIFLFHLGSPHLDHPLHGQRGEEGH